MIRWNKCDGKLLVTWWRRQCEDKLLMIKTRQSKPEQRLPERLPPMAPQHLTLSSLACGPIIITSSRGNNVDLVLCVLLGHQNSKIANSMKLVNFALFSSQYHVFELKNIRGNLIAPNSNRWSLSNKIAMSQEDNRKIISLFGQEKSIFLHPWMLKDLM